MLINSSYLIALLLAIAIEVVVASFFGYRKKTEIATIIFVNLITNPLLNYLLFVNNYFDAFRISTAVILFCEIVVVLTEWLLLVFALKKNPKRLFVLSVIMNFCSYIAGVFIYTLPVGILQ